jgi:hypothetical protein
MPFSGYISDREPYLNKLVPFLLLSILTVFPLSAQEDSPFQQIEWTPNPSARGYLVVFLRDGIEVFSKETTDTRLFFSLPPGRYIWTVTVINKFGKEGGKSDPQDLIIEKIHEPLVKRGIPGEVWSDQKSVEMTIELYQLHRKGEVFLTQGSMRVPGDILIRGEDRIQVRFDLDGFEPGICDLELQNPAGVSGSYPGILLIKEKRTPVFSWMSSEFLYAGSLYTDIIVTGTGFEPGMKAVFKDGSREIVPAQIEVVTDTEARMWLDLRQSVKGNYSLRLDNPSGRGSGGSDIVLVVDYTEEFYWKERNFGSDLLVSGICFFVPEMGPGGEPAFLPGGGIKIDIDFTDKVPFLRGWCFEIRGDFAILPGDEPSSAVMAGMAMVFRTRFNSSFNFFAKGGMGGQWTFGNEPQNGPLFFAAAGIDMNFFLHLIFQLEVNYYLFVHEGGSSSYFPIGVSVGYRF